MAAAALLALAGCAADPPTQTVEGPREFAAAPVPTCFHHGYAPRSESLPEAAVDVLTSFFLVRRDPGYRSAAEQDERRKFCGCSAC